MAWLLGCASGARVAPPAPLDRTDRGLPKLWGAPAAELATQRVVKLHYQGDEGDATLNLIFRLEHEDRFSLQGNDRLGRSWFRLAVDGERALLLDLREKTYCSYDTAIELSAVPLGPLPFDRLPALLLGRLPTEPVTQSRRPDGSWRIVDAEGREWTAEVVGDTLERWTLWQGGEPVVWWFREDSLSYLSARQEGLQLRWRVPRGERLSRPPDDLAVPDAYAPSLECGEGSRWVD